MKGRGAFVEDDPGRHSRMVVESDGQGGRSGARGDDHIVDTVPVHLIDDDPGLGCTGVGLCHVCDLGCQVRTSAAFLTLRRSSADLSRSGRHRSSNSGSGSGRRTELAVHRYQRETGGIALDQ